MSLIQRITYHKIEDSLNEGYKLCLAGTYVGDVTDSVLRAVSGEQAVMVSAICLSSSTATPCLVSIGFKKVAEPTVEFFRAYVSLSGPVVKVPVAGDWYRGTNSYDLVITITGLSGNLAVSIDSRLTSDKEPLGYIEQIGSPNHSSPRFADENAVNRGVTVV